MSEPGVDSRFLHRAALLALRGHGHVEPNPMVGCIITDASGTIVGTGHHEHFGGPHAEINALRSAGDRARGGTMYVTLEPCAHHGKTPPCVDAIIAAGIFRVVIAQSDPSETAREGAARLREAGIEVEFNDSSALANDVSAPFRYRAQTGLPWVIAKWAQTMDGRIVADPGEPRWISGEASRRMVHRERGRVDAILTGIGTVRADDPLLNIRGVTARRVPRRIVIDPSCQLRPGHRIVATADRQPTTVVCNSLALAATRQQWLLESKHCEVVAFGSHERLPLRIVLGDLARRYELTTVLVEAGEGLIRSLFTEGLVNQAWAFIGGGAQQVQEAVESSLAFVARMTGNGMPPTVQWARRRQNDLIIMYRVAAPASSQPAES